ncbi:MAG: methionine synthase [Phycisphaeraceae bacterium]
MSNFATQFRKKVLFLDGAMGTSIHNYELDLEKDYLGKENCTEILVQSRPDVIQEIHESFLEAGSDAVETDSFGSNKLVLAEFDLVDQTYELNKRAAEIARAACEKYATADRPRFVIGSMGPGTKLPSLGHTDWDPMFDSYREQVRGLIDGGSDALLIETCQDILQVKCAVAASLAAMDEKGTDPEKLPILVHVTIETTGTMLLGTEIAAAAQALHPLPILSLGLNCATGPVEMAEHVTWLSKHWDRGISVLPNAGLPTLVDGKTEYPLRPQPFAEKVDQFVRDLGVNIVGGCCGTTPEHIQALYEKVGDRAPAEREIEPFPAGCTSLYTPVPYRQDTSILNVGERTNASGSRRFKRLLEEENWDEMISLAREQLREGSHVIDVNVDYAGRDNAEDMRTLVSKLVRQVPGPLMLDSTQPDTIEAGLKHAGGKCVINSANLEEGEEKFAQMVGLARRFGAGLVLGTIDEDPDEAMARTADRKLEIAERMHRLATEKYGLAEEDILFDPLVLPVSTGMEKDRRSALETIEGVRRIMARFPNCQTLVGLSNVSFGLKPAARQVLNSVFQHELMQAGLTGAIVHASKILPRNKIEDEQWDAALDLIYDRREEGTDPLEKFIDLFPEGTEVAAAKQDLKELPLEERLQQHIIDGEKRDLEQTLDEALAKYAPVDIINDHLLGGMKVVGDLFGSGQMQLPFVLQSAEVMKQAVAHLEQHMEKSDGQSKGSMVLATVKGDVHDIGKNLVDIILSNNGYTVHNIGIKQPVSAIIEAFEDKKADAIGLSGLLVKSVQVMEENLNEFNERGIGVPVILGGAALSRHHCEGRLRELYEGNLFYGLDAFEGLRLMDHIVAGKTEELNADIDERLGKRAEVEKKISEREAKREQEKESQEGGTAVAEQVRSDVATDVEVPEPPFWGDRVVEEIDLDQVYPFINQIALFRGQWQLKKGKLSQEEYDRLIEDEARPVFERLKQQCKEERILNPRVVYGYYPCQSEGDDLVIFDAENHDREVERFTFPRQGKRKRLCISDYFKSADSGEKDVIGLTCVTMGEAASQRTKELFENNDYQDYLYLHGFSVESAEALAEMWHKRMRQELGIGGDDAPSMKQLFAQGYRGSRYSFGYPACPNMQDQEKIWRLIHPERIGCRLTENWQIDPEQSTSALVVHHPEAKYFSA